MMLAEPSNVRRFLTLCFFVCLEIFYRSFYIEIYRKGK